MIHFENAIGADAAVMGSRGFEDLTFVAETEVVIEFDHFFEVLFANFLFLFGVALIWHLALDAVWEGLVLQECVSVLGSLCVINVQLYLSEIRENIIVVFVGLFFHGHTFVAFVQELGAVSDDP